MTEPRVDEREHGQLMSDYTALWNGDFSKLEVLADVVDLYHPDAPDGELHGREAVEAFIREFHSGFSDFHIEVLNWISDNGVIMKEYTLTGTHDGEFNGIPPTGREVESTGMATILVGDGKVQEDRIYFNQLEALQQLGLADL